MSKVIIKLYENNDMNVELEGLQNAASGKWITDATVAVTMYDSGTQNEVTGHTWPLPLAYVANTQGLYRGTVQSTNDLVDGDLVDVKITADSAGINGEWFFEKQRVRKRSE